MMVTRPVPNRLRRQSIRSPAFAPNLRITRGLCKAPPEPERFSGVFPEKPFPAEDPLQFAE